MRTRMVPGEEVNGGAKRRSANPDAYLWLERMAERGWTVPTWPRAYGGGGLEKDEFFVLLDELQRIGARPPLGGMGVTMIGPTLLEYGNEEQKRRHLPRIARGEVAWCQGYSEPGAGSDLASLQTKAEDRGDHFVVNGAKIWTSGASHADWMFCLVRTSNEDIRQLGISFLLIDMNTPGIEVKPIITLDEPQDGYQEINMVYFEDVKVPKENLIGEEGKGWTVAKHLLEHERISGGGSGELRTALSRVRAIASQERNGDGARLIDDPAFARKLDETGVSIEAIQFTEFRIMAEISKGGSPGPESSIMKNLGADMGQYLTELTVEALGFYATPHQPEAREVGQNVPPIGPADGLTAFPRYFNLRASSIAGGTNEVQKNIIGRRGLGLP